jgi:hypothetical protein
MSDTLDQYREAKNNYMKLRAQARKELIARFHSLAAELFQLQRELLEDFGEKVPLPKPKKVRTAKVAVSTPAAKPAPAPPSPPSPKMTSLQKQLERQKQKLADAKAAGKPVKAIDDRIYEIEDEIRLLNENA